MSLDMRVEQLESEMLMIRKMLHHKDENQHEIWNDMQERIREKVDKIYSLAEELTVSNASIKAKLELHRSELKLLQLEQHNTNQRLSGLEISMTEVKEMLHKLMDK